MVDWTLGRAKEKKGWNGEVACLFEGEGRVDVRV
jgi:hypothetical protein